MNDIPQTRDRSHLKYWGFISYSHRDKRTVKRIQKKLESYRIPRNRVGTNSPVGVLPTRLRPFFRDEDALPMSPDLAEPIQSALRESRSLVVICSPRSAKSEYVNAEVLFFKRLSQDERYSCIIIEGEPRYPEISEDECFCDALRFQMGQDGELTETVVEPLAGNAPNTSLDQECIRVIATITGIPFDELWDRFRKDRFKRMMIWTIVGFIMLAIVAVISNIAIEAKKVADAEKIRADEEFEIRRFSDYLSLISSAEKDISYDDYAAAEGKLQSCPKDLRDWEWYYLSHQISPAIAVVRFPEARLTAVDMAPNGNLIAAGTNDGRVLVWEQATRELVKILDHGQLTERVRQRGDTSPVKSVCFSPDGEKIISASHDGRLVIWETGTFTIHKIMNGTEPTVCCWLPNSRDLLRLSEEKLVVWDSEAEVVKATMDGNVFRISSLDVTTDGRFLVIADFTSRVRVWDLQTGRIRQQMTNPTGGVFAVSIHPRGEYVAGGTDNGSILVWSIETGNELIRLRGHVGPVNSLDWKSIEVGFERFDDQIVSGGEDRTVKIWNTSESQAITTLRGHQDPVNGVTWSPDGKSIASSSRDATVRLWNPGNASRSVTLPGRFRELKSVVNTQDSIFASGVEPFASNPNGFAGNISLIRWGKEPPYQFKTFGSPQAGHAIALSKVDEEIIGLFEDGRIRVWNSKTLKTRVSTSRLTGTPVDLAVSPDETELWACSYEGNLWIVDLDSLKETRTFHLGKPLISGIHLLNDQLLTISSDGQLRIWDSDHLNNEAEVSLHEGAIISSCLDRKRKVIYSSGTDGKLSCYSLEDDLLLSTIDLPMGLAYSLALHPNGQRLAAGHHNGLISILDTQGRQLLTHEGHRNSVDHLQFADDGETLVSVSHNGAVILWNAPR